MSQAQKYRKKPIVVEAIQFHDTTRSIAAISDFAGQAVSFDFRQTPTVLKIETPEGTMIAKPGDYIIRGIKGEFYPCKPDIFEATYELVPEPPQFQLGEKVQHKTYKSYSVGVVQGISKSGKKVKVHWPKWHFSSYYDPASLEKVDDGT